MSGGMSVSFTPPATGATDPAAPASTVVSKETPGTDGKGISVTPPAETQVPAPQDEADKMAPADLLKAYKELRTKMSKGEKPEGDKAQTPEEKAAADKAVADKAAADAKAASDKAASEKAAEAYEAGVAATFEKAAGSPEKVTEVLSWAKENLDADSAKAFDAALDSGNAVMANYAIKVMMDRFTEANGQEPGRSTFVPASGTPGVTPFADASEMTKAISDPRYETSEAYRQQVKARIAASKY